MPLFLTIPEVVSDIPFLFGFGIVISFARGSSFGLAISFLVISYVTALVLWFFWVDSFLV